MAYFEPPDKRVQQNVRMPRSLKRKLLDLQRLWIELAKLRPANDPDDKVDPDDIDLTYVIVRLLNVGVDGAWAEVGGRPETEEQWEELLKKLKKVHAQK